MPNLAALYTEVTKNPVIEELYDSPLDKPIYDVGRHEMELRWLESTPTIEFVLNIENQVKILLDQAVDLSLSYPQHQNPHGIIQRLVTVASLRKTLQDIYGKRK